MDHDAAAMQMSHGVSQTATESNCFRCSETLAMRVAHLADPPPQILTFNPGLDDRDVVTTPMVFENLGKFGILLAETLQDANSLPSLVGSGQQLQNPQGSVRASHRIKHQIAATRFRTEPTSDKKLLSTDNDPVNDFVPLAFEVEMVWGQNQHPPRPSGTHGDCGVTRWQRVFADIRLVNTCQ